MSNIQYAEVESGDDPSSADQVDTDDVSEVAKYIASSMAIGFGLGMMEGLFIVYNPFQRFGTLSLEAKRQAFFRLGLFNAVPTSIVSGVNAVTQILVRKYAPTYVSYASPHVTSVAMATLYGTKVFQNTLKSFNRVDRRGLFIDNYFLDPLLTINPIQAFNRGAIRREKPQKIMSGLLMFINLEATEAIMHHLAMPSV